MIRRRTEATSPLQQVAEIFRHKMNLDVPSAETDLFETGLLDSLGFVNLLVSLEETFEIKLSLEELDVDHFRTLTGIAELIETRLPRHAVESGLEQGRREAEAVHRSSDATRLHPFFAG